MLEIKLKQYRKEKGLSQENLAQIVGVTRQTINALEANKYNPSLDLAYKICDALDKEITDIFIYIREEN